MRFFVPAVGTTFKLLEPWTFLLYVERRNESLFNAFGSNIQHLEWKEVTPYWGWAGGNVSTQRHKFEQPNANGHTQCGKAARFILPAGSILRVKRVYIRSGQKGEFDSVTMSVRETTHPFLIYAGKTKSGKRKKSLGDFWVKLCDFNTIDGEVIDENVRLHKSENP